MESSSELEQLELNALHQPNSIEFNQALAEAYAKEERWEEATEVYQTVVALYPAVAALNINRIRLGAIALGISSLLFFASAILRPSAAFADTPFYVAEYLGSPALALSHILFLPILVLLSCAAISVYKLLSTSRDNRLTFWAMVSIIIGAGLFLPFFGINAVVLPAAAQLYISGNTSALDIYDAVFQQPLAIVFTLGGFLLFVGLALVNVAVWSSGYLPKWASTLLWIGWSLFIVTQPLPFVFLIEELYWIYKPMLFAWLIAIGGIGLAHGVWQQAPRQLAPKATPAKKAYS